MVQLVGGNPRGPRRYNVQRQQLKPASPVKRVAVQPSRRPIQQVKRPINSIDGFTSSSPSRRPTPPLRHTYKQQQQQVKPSYTQAVLERQQEAHSKKRLNLWFNIRKILKNRYALGSGLMMLSLVAGATILLWPQQSLSETELEYFRQKLTTIQEVSQEVKKHNSIPIEQTVLDNNINSYNEALLKGLIACEEIDNHVDTTSKELLEPYIDAIQQVRYFCSDFEDVVDYARKVSKATKQIITYDIRRVTDNSSNKGIQDVNEILDFTRIDVDKLKGLPAQDPANEEMLIMISDTQKLATAALSDPSDTNRQALADGTHNLRYNFMTARQYFWKNTVKVDAMLRSINRLHGLFQEDKF